MTAQVIPIRPPREKRMPRNFSASQVEVALDCFRKWAYRWLWGMTMPTTPAQQRGTGVHKSSENLSRLISAEKSAEIDRMIGDELFLRQAGIDPEHVPFLRALAPHLPKPGEDCLVEHKIVLDTPYGLPWDGYIDLFLFERVPPVLIDFKTTGDLRYAKRPIDFNPGQLLAEWDTLVEAKRRERLQKMLQIVTYGQWIFTTAAGEVDRIKAGNVYIEMPRKDRERKSLPRVLPVMVELEPVSVRGVWQRVMPVLEEMLQCAQLDDPHDVPPNPQSCDKFGGCPYRTECGLSPLAKVTAGKHLPAKNPNQKNERSKPMTSFLERMRGKSNGQTTPAPAPAPAPTPAAAPAPAPADTAKPSGLARFGKPPAVAQPAVQPSPAPQPAAAAPAPAPEPQPAPVTVPTGVVPPDAPPRDSTEPLAVGDPGVSKKRGRKPAAAAQTTAEPEAQTQTESTAPVAATKPKKSFTLYVDCFPRKRPAGELEPTEFADWIGPVILALNEWAASEMKVEDYRLLAFAQEKVALEQALLQQIAKGLPSSMVISSAGLGREALPLLIPYASHVVQPFRGG